jgi:acetyl/propionyl-CoA carboxylase alpha subunit
MKVLQETKFIEGTYDTGFLENEFDFSKLEEEKKKEQDLIAVISAFLWKQSDKKAHIQPSFNNSSKISKWKLRMKKFGRY